MKRLYILLFCICIFNLNAFSQATKDAADAAYQQEKFRTAISMYEELLSKEGASASVYYNLGNSYFKLKSYGKAILQYERALLLEPGDEDILHNLSVAKSKTVDKIIPRNKTFIALWWENSIQAFHETTWSIVGIICFILCLGGVLVYFFVQKLSWRKVGFFSACVAVPLCLFANYAAYLQAQRITEHQTAIVMQAAIMVKSTPANTGTDLFLIHEGTKVEIQEGLSNEWYEVRLADGKKGWIPQNSVERI